MLIYTGQIGKQGIVARLTANASSSLGRVLRRQLASIAKENKTTDTRTHNILTSVLRERPYWNFLHSQPDEMVGWRRYMVFLKCCRIENLHLYCV